jgi:hypothetical protein
MPEGVPVARHNVVAAFSEAAQADAAVDRLVHNGIERSAISMNTRTDAAIIADAEMRSEADSFVGGPGLVATESQRKGGVLGAAIGGLVGALIGLGLGALLFGTLGMILTGATGLAAGAVVAGVAGGSIRPTVDEGAQPSLEGYRATVGVHGDATQVATAARILRDGRAVQVRTYGPDHEPFQVPLTGPEDPEPRDPPHPETRP